MRRPAAVIALLLVCVTVFAQPDLSFADRMQIARLKDRIHLRRRKLLHLLRFLTTVYEGMEELEEALSFAQRVLELDDRNETDALRVANQLSKLGRPEEAVALLAGRTTDVRPSVRLCRAIAAFARDTGDETLAQRWEQRATAPFYSSASEHLTAASWLYSTGYLSECEDEWHHILELQPTGSQAVSVHQSLARAASSAQRWHDAGTGYIRAAELRAEQRGGALDSLTRRYGAKGYALRALARTLATDDAGARTDAVTALRWTGGDLWAVSDLLRALDTAPPAPWFIELFEQTAADGNWSSVSLYAEAIRHSAERWLEYQRSLPVLIKSDRELSDEKLAALASERFNIRWVRQDSSAKGQRWIGTERRFMMLDCPRRWVVQWWPDVLEEAGVPTLDARCAAFGAETVWVGTGIGLFAFERRRSAWTQCVIGEDLEDLCVTDLKLQDGRLTVDTAADGKESRWVLDLTSQTWKRP